MLLHLCSHTLFQELLQQSLKQQSTLLLSDKGVSHSDLFQESLGIVQNFKQKDFLFTNTSCTCHRGVFFSPSRKGKFPPWYE